MIWMTVSSNTENMLPLLISLIAGGVWIGVIADYASDDHGLPHAVAYDLDTFNAQIPLQAHFIMFYAPWFVSTFYQSVL